MVQSFILTNEIIRVIIYYLAGAKTALNYLNVSF